MASKKLNPFDAPGAPRQEAISPSTTAASSDIKSGRLIVLASLGILISILMALITFLSLQFDLTLPFLDRPIVEVVACFVAAFWLYLAAMVVGRKIPDSVYLTTTIIGFAVLFRLMMFVSYPIQEVDIYRYIWDGIVLSEGVSPFRYSPDQVRNTPVQKAMHDQSLRKLVTRYRQGGGTADALNLVHFGQVPTVYPPVSQVVFGAAALTTPKDATLLFRLRVMKAWLLAFDLGTVLLLISLLRSLQMPTVFAISYAWCPLVLKEIGNSGHLDSIAIFLTTLAVVSFVRNIMLRSPKTEHVSDHQFADKNQSLGPDSHLSGIARTSLARNLLPVIFLALAIGAKIYAIVLVPLFVFVAIRRLGWQSTIVPALVFIAVMVAVSFPMIPHKSTEVAQAAPQNAPAAPNTDPTTGLSIFVKYWEMNDFIFMNTVENLKPPSLPSRKDAWFSVLPEEPREKLSSFVQDKFNTEPNLAPFLTTRFLLTTVFVIVAFSISIWAVLQNDPVVFCRAAFLTLAWFWLLAPTQNPWYWLWALPLIPFIKNRTWYLMSGLLFIYYLRFWFEYHCAGVPAVEKLSITLPEWASTASKYQGVDFFDFVVTWFEYLPWFVLLIFETFCWFFVGLFRKNSEPVDLHTAN